MFRDADDEDLIGLLRLERAANLAALAHVFPPEQYPFPDAAVLEDWRIAVADPSRRVMVAGEPDRLHAVVMYDEGRVHKLAVHPDQWGHGLATRALDTALAAMRDRGTSTAWLWCLEANPRARRLYEHLGWADTGEREPSKWPPYPHMMRYRRPVG